MGEFARLDAGLLLDLAPGAFRGSVAVEHAGADLQHLGRAVGEKGRHAELPDQQHDAPVGIVEQHRSGEAVTIDLVADLEGLALRRAHLRPRAGDGEAAFEQLAVFEDLDGKAHGETLSGRYA